MLTKHLFVVLPLSMVYLAGCDGGSNGTSCIAGASVACACTNGQNGAQTCSSAGTFEPCVCMPPLADGGSGLTADSTGTTTGDSANAESRGATAGSETADVVLDAMPESAPSEGGLDALPDVSAADEAMTDERMSDSALDVGNRDSMAVPASDTAAEGGTLGTQPTIVSFGASPSVISAGESTTLNWSVGGASMLTVDEGIGSNLVSVLGTTSRVVTPIRTTTYTLTLNASTTAQVTVEVVPRPLISSFVASPTVVGVGGSATLTAVFSGASATVDQGIGTIESGKAVPIGPIQTVTTYTLTVKNSLGVVVSKQLTVEPLVFSQTGPLSFARSGHTATLLPDGRVLVAGGGADDAISRSAELYDRASGTFTTTGAMRVGRGHHTATLLQSGKVLITGGWVRSAELYDPATGTFTSTGDMLEIRTQHTATLLQSGKVLVAGGFSSGASPGAELYDPSTGTFSATGSMGIGRAGHSSTVLSNGTVLVAGGSAGNGNTDVRGSAEIYDPATSQFTTAGTMTTPRWEHTATRLRDGTVLIVGGTSSNTSGNATSEIFDPATKIFTATGKLRVARTYHTATLMPDDTVLVVAGKAPTIFLQASSRTTHRRRSSDRSAA